VILAADAGVALEWLSNVGDSEPDRDRALTLLTGVDDESVQLVQPAHFIAAVAAVLARAKPDGAEDDLLDLLSIECSTIEIPETYATALELSIRHQHHLFDTLYHAVALHVPGASLIAADRRCYDDKASGEGRIILLAETGRPTDRCARDRQRGRGGRRRYTKAVSVILKQPLGISLVRRRNVR